LLAVILTIQSTYAQINIEDLLGDEDVYYEDQIIMRLPMHDVLFDDTPVTEEIVEGVGSIIYAAAPVRSSPNRTSNVVRFALPGEKMIITTDNGEWFGVRMYNGRQGFIERRYLRTVKVFYDESVTINHMNKRLSIELNRILKRFQNTMSESVYLEKYHIVPQLTLSHSSMASGVITITLEYSAVNTNGNIIPSRQVNELGNELQKFIELLFMKMLTVKAKSYVIIIKRPQFSSNGRVLDMNGEYAEYDDAIIDRIRSQNRNILGLVKSTIPVNDLFRTYPY
jgi:hypothetical protein